MIWALAAFGHVLLGIVLVILKLVICLLFGAVFLLWYEQGCLLYIPNVQAKRQLMYNSPAILRSPSNFKLMFEDIYITTKDSVAVHAWLVKAKNYQHAPTWIYFHGNAANIGYRLPNVAEFVNQLGINVLMLEYRGFGNSEGAPSERGLMLDGEAALEYIRSRRDIDQEKVYLFGRSLGGAVAIAVAARLWKTSNPPQQPLAGVVVENTFTSIFDMIVVLGQRMRIGDLSCLKRILVNFFLTSVWNSIRDIKHIKDPILFLSGQADELVPPEQMKRLFTACASPNATWEEFPDGQHNETSSCKGYIESIARYLKATSDHTPPTQQMTFQAVS